MTRVCCIGAAGRRLRPPSSGAHCVLALGGTATAAGWEALLSLDAELVRRFASPGGCADLLAACLFLDDSLREACMERLSFTTPHASL